MTHEEKVTERKRQVAMATWRLCLFFERRKEMTMHKMDKIVVECPHCRRTLEIKTRVKSVSVLGESSTVTEVYESGLSRFYFGGELVADTGPTPQTAQIPVMKAIRDKTGMDLKQAKDLWDKRKVSSSHQGRSTP